ncbi:hypothetical protein [Ottowia beijingensis]|uniref:hypothetical protein n=1 Tax=Ottowia beijingensis TaxID=1207057 RepID=UPI0027D9EB74|nr:hypothetical protein [Ottowia beijingensis]
MTRAARVIRFIEGYLCVPEGKDVGKPMVLADFQKKFLIDVFDNPHGTRRAILSMGRKGAKLRLSPPSSPRLSWALKLDRMRFWFQAPCRVNRHRWCSGCAVS